jgi:23S rRNA (pseudouridine1915-N3)-methyltransferase
MRITVLCIAKTSDPYILEGMEEFKKRLKHFIKLDWIELPEVKNRKNLNQEQLLAMEEELFLKNLNPGDSIYLLDENGKEYSSRQFSTFINKKMIASTQNLVFLIGGPYGFSKGMYAKADGKISLSKMTFTHQMVRLFFVEQLYRAFSILKNLPYHHD